MLKYVSIHRTLNVIEPTFIDSVIINYFTTQVLNNRAITNNFKKQSDSMRLIHDGMYSLIIPLFEVGLFLQKQNKKRRYSAIMI